MATEKTYTLAGIHRTAGGPGEVLVSFTQDGTEPPFMVNRLLREPAKEGDFNPATADDAACEAEARKTL